jgi:hypothetical protein
VKYYITDKIQIWRNPKLIPLLVPITTAISMVSKIRVQNMTDSSKATFQHIQYIMVMWYFITVYRTLTLSNPIFLPTAYSPALICFGWERGWCITCNYPTVLKEKNIQKQKEYNLCYLLAKVHTTWGKASDRLRQRANKRNRNRVGRLPTLEQNRKIILSDEIRRRIGKG